MGFDASAKPKTIAPPAARKTPNTSMGRASEKAREAKTIEREEGLNGWGQIGVGACLATGQFADAGAVSVHWPNVARETAALADKYESVANVVDKFVAAGPFAGLITAVMPLVFQVLVNHNRMPASPMLAQFGVMPKETLELQGQATAMRMAQEALRAQQEAQAEMAAIQAEMLAQNGATPEAEKIPA